MNGTFQPAELERLIEESGVAFSQNSRSFLLDCPECGKRGKLWILKKNGAFVCWSCQETNSFKGWATEALARLTGRPESEIRGRLYDGAPPPGMELELDISDFGSEEDLIDMPIAPQEIEWPWDSVTIDAPAGKKGADYLKGRGVPLAVADHYGVRYWPAERRVLFPVSVEGKLLGYQGRAIFETKGTKIPKIKTSEGLRKNHVLMFQDNLKGSNHAIIGEGPMDAIKMDFPRGNVATMGKAMSKEQVAIIRSYGIREIYLALDPDAAAEICALVLEFGDMNTYLVLPPAGKKDLGECSFVEGDEAFRNARPFMSGNLLLDFRRHTLA
jgi:hypothetical protein